MGQAPTEGYIHHLANWIYREVCKIANFSGEPFENSLNNIKKVNYSKFSISFKKKHI